MPTADPVSAAAAVESPWHDTSLPVEERVNLLLEQMTLEEKVAQLGSRWVGNDRQAADEDGAQEPDSAPDLQVAPMDDVLAARGSLPLAEASRHGLGHLTRVYGSAPVSPAEGARELVRQQQTVQASRLRIPRSSTRSA